MIAKLRALDAIRLFVSYWPFGRQVHKAHIVFFALALLVAMSVTGSAFAQQGFALIGTWQQTDKDGIQTVVFKPDGTFFSQWDFPPGPGGTGSGRAQWQGIYRATGASSYAAQVGVFQVCASGGGCVSCPPGGGELPGSDGCGLARYYGLTPGEWREVSMQMQGPDQGVLKDGRRWRRIR
jgi:hypothetical protein